MSDKERLQKYLAQSGVSSRRGAEKLILAGKVKVNGKTVTELGIKIDPETDQVQVDGKVVKPEAFRYILLNKPKGYVCTKADRFAEKTIYDLVPNDVNLHSVGRLDKDTEGLILLTNDGALTQKLTHPSYQVKKTYQALVKGKITNEALNALRKGVLIDVDGSKIKTQPAKVKVLSLGQRTSTIELTIKEGRKRQVRLMCEAVGFPVVELKRIKEGILDLKNLKTGKYRFLKKEEINKLK